MDIHPGRLYDLLTEFSVLIFHSGYPVSSSNVISNIAVTGFQSEADGITSKIVFPIGNSVVINYSGSIPEVVAVSLGNSARDDFYASAELDVPIPASSTSGSITVPSRSMSIDFALTPPDPSTGLRDGWQQWDGSGRSAGDSALNFFISAPQRSFGASVGFPIGDIGNGIANSDPRFRVSIHGAHPLAESSGESLGAGSIVIMQLRDNIDSVGFVSGTDLNMVMGTTATPAYIAFSRIGTSLGTIISEDNLIMAQPITGASEVQSGETYIIPVGTSFFTMPEAT